MAEETKTVLTLEGKINYEKKLNYLKTTRREQISERIRTAREFGDISENAEYENAKIEQAFVEGEISDLEKLLKNAVVINKSEVKTDQVGLGTVVTIENVTKDSKRKKTVEAPEKEILSLEIVGTRETNPQHGRISNECPLGLALHEHGIGDIVDVRTPAGVISWKILEIRAAEAKSFDI